MSCPLCSVDENRIAFSTELVIAIWDDSSASPGHLLIVPRRHARSWTDLSSAEKAATWSAIDQGQAAISERFRPDGFNVGFDQGLTAGQTVFHFYLHIIPRYEGDVADRQRGAPGAIPVNTAPTRPGQSLPDLAIKRLITGGDDPLLPHLLLHLDKSTTCDIAVAFWRLAHYLSQPDSRNVTADIICRVVRNGDQPPLLLLPNAATALHLEQSPAPVRIDETAYEVIVEKSTINVVRAAGEDVNLLPQMLRRWFGDEAGLPGHNDRIRLKRGSFGLEMEPLRISSSQRLQVWERYQRDAIAPAFGLVFSQAIWNAGFVVQDPEVFLLVTLAKHDMNTEHRYIDQFVSDSEFAWQSQNRTTKTSKHGQLLRNHRAMGKRVHLLVRPTKKTGSKPTPFIYCGEVDFVSWEGDAPISIRWRLRESVPPPLRGLLGVPS